MVSNHFILLFLDLSLDINILHKTVATEKHTTAVMQNKLAHVSSLSCCELYISFHNGSCSSFMDKGDCCKLVLLPQVST